MTSCAATAGPRPARRAVDESGQASVEYLLVGLALIALVVALAALWHAAADGKFATLVQTGASHALDQPGGIADALLF